jgi:uncharacterized membrane protein YdbT with pleckstrin-like domain
VGYAEKQLAPGEAILYRARYHWVIYTRGILFLAAAVALAVAAFARESSPGAEGQARALAWAGGVLAVIGLSLLLFRAVRASADEFVVTDRRVIHKMGLVAHETRQCPLSKIQDVTVDQTVPGRLFGYGDLGVETASERGQIVFPSIRDPEQLRTAIWTHVGTGGEVAAAEPVRAANAASRMAELKQMKENGLLTEAEYEGKRREILRDL